MRLAYQNTTFWAKISGVWAKGASKKIWDPIRISATAEVSNFKFGTQIWFGTKLPKRRLGPKLAGSWLGVHPQKIGTAYLFLQPLKLATSNLVRNLCLGLSYQKQRFGPKLAGVWAKGASKKVGTSTYFCNR